MMNGADREGNSIDANQPGLTQQRRDNRCGRPTQLVADWLLPWLSRLLDMRVVIDIASRILFTAYFASLANGLPLLLTR